VVGGWGGGVDGSLLSLNIHSLNDCYSTLHLYLLRSFLQIWPKISRQISDRSWTAILKIPVIWNMTPCKLVLRYQCFGGAYSLQVHAVQFRRTLLLQSSGWSRTGLYWRWRQQSQSLLGTLVSICKLHGLVFWKTGVFISAAARISRLQLRIEGPCLSVGLHSAAAFAVLFDHSGLYEVVYNLWRVSCACRWQYVDILPTEIFCD